ncbi:hypothetical protein VQ01_14445 [Tamlana sp. s12]|nr:hypothetical protein VQ01_14445 [Tamlana sp. s12]
MLKKSRIFADFKQKITEKLFSRWFVLLIYDQVVNTLLILNDGIKNLKFDNLKQLTYELESTIKLRIQLSPNPYKSYQKKYVYIPKYPKLLLST